MRVINTLTGVCSHVILEVCVAGVGLWTQRTGAGGPGASTAGIGTGHVPQSRREIRRL